MRLADSSLDPRGTGFAPGGVPVAICKRRLTAAPVTADAALITMRSGTWIEEALPGSVTDLPSLMAAQIEGGATLGSMSALKSGAWSDRCRVAAIAWS